MFKKPVSGRRNASSCCLRGRVSWGFMCPFREPHLFSVGVTCQAGTISNLEVADGEQAAGFRERSVLA